MSKHEFTNIRVPIEKDNREQLSEKDAKAPTLRELKEILKCE